MTVSVPCFAAIICFPQPGLAGIGGRQPQGCCPARRWAAGGCGTDHAEDAGAGAAGGDDGREPAAMADEAY